MENLFLLMLDGRQPPAAVWDIFKDTHGSIMDPGLRKVLTANKKPVPVLTEDNREQPCNS